ncbi:unnamed protein product [Caenorhabditis sp. 36 PRJEB53466]|nr:unnamed protein product [Caenorhabditis sp. 36 PRJEB53466]
MTDEANPYFPVSVDNIVEGFQFIHENFGIKPSTIWSNDPFGYSNSVPYLFKKSGVSRTVINRIHHRLKQTLQSQQAVPFRWRQYFDPSGSDEILAHVLPYSHYDILNSCGPGPSDCCEFDFKRMTQWACPGPAPVNISKSNVAEKANTLLNQLEQMAEMYKAPVILMMHGDDFRFDMLQEWYQHHDNFLPLFDEINKGNRAEIRFGTFNDYFNELEKWHSENEKVEETRPPTLSGDFFPYMCALGDYWTGYFTTRPFFKRQGRLLHSLIRSADIMLSMLRGNLKQRKIDTKIGLLEAARRNLSLFQHHDAITGTSKVSVMDNYSELLHSSIISTKTVIEELGKGELDIYPRIHDGVEIQQLLDFQKNSQEKMIKIFNSLLFSTTDLHGIRVNHPELQLSIDGKMLETQLEPYFIKGKLEKDSFLLFFRATVPPMSMIKVKIVKGNSEETMKSAKIEAKGDWQLGEMWSISPSSSLSSELCLESPFLKTHHNPTSGSLQNVTLLSSKTTFTAEQTWHKYRDAAGGAYLMKLHTNPKEMVDFKWLKVSGPLRETIYQATDTVFQRTSVKNVEGPAGEELDISMSIDISKERNTELMTRIATNWEAPNTFTDSIGLQLLKRDFYKLPVQNNYYPMPTGAVLEKNGKRLSILSNVEHGARFMEHGTVEINIDRILNQDDGKGLGQGADAIPIDLKPVDMRFKLIFDENVRADNSHYSVHSSRAQQALQRVIYPPILLNSEKIPKMEDIEEIEENSKLAFPCDLQLLTVRPLSDNRQLLIFYRHATTCTDRGTDNCGAELKKSLFNLLLKLGARRVQRTDLSGVTAIGNVESVEHLPDFDLKTFDFLTLVLYR